MNKYQSAYTSSYFRDKCSGTFYDRGISNKFELFLFELEKNFLFHLILPIKKNLKKVRYLDFACGTGRIMNVFRETFDTIKAIDTNPDQLAVAKEKVPNAEFVLGNIVSHPELVKDNSVDLITSFRFFLNLEFYNRGIILKQFYRILSDKGFLIIDNHMNRYSILGLTALFMRKILGYSNKYDLKSGQKGIINTMTESEITTLLLANGFEILRINRFGLIPGHNSICLLPVRWLIPLEMFLSKIPVLNLISKNQIFFCKKI